MNRKLILRSAGAVLGSALILATAFQAEAAPRRHYRGGGNGAVAALAFGAVALGFGAAIASSQRREREFVPAYGYPAYGYPAQSYPVYGNGYGAPEVDYAPQVQYVPQPVYAPSYPYGYVQPRRNGNYWMRQARERQMGF